MPEGGQRPLRERESRIGMPVTAQSDALCAWGRQVLSPAEWALIAGALRLSPRELDVVQCIFDDHTEASMARQLAISVHTVHTHLERLYRKLGVSTRCGAAIRVFAEYAGPRSPSCAVGCRTDSNAAPQS